LAFAKKTPGGYASGMQLSRQYNAVLKLHDFNGLRHDPARLTQSAGSF